MHVMPVPSDRAARLTELRRRIDMIEQSRFDKGVVGDHKFTEAPSTSPDPLRVDPFLLSGNTGPALHELVADGYGSHPALRHFTLALIASLLPRQQDSQAMVLWCQRQWDALEFGRLYGPGLRALGLPPDRFLMVNGKRDDDCLWAMEQGLASRSLLAVVGAVDHVGLIASRRLSLAASAHRTFCFLLPLHHGREPSAARTRWQVGSVPSSENPLDPKSLGLPAWHLELKRSPHGQTGHWALEWDHAAHHFHLVQGQPAAGGAGPDQENGEVVAFERTG